MKKIIIAFDGTNFSEGAFEFARRLNETSPILLTGVFMPQVDYASLWSYAGAMAGPVYIPLIEEEEGELIQKNIEHFQSLCIHNGISFRVHRDYNDFALFELKRESRFADLLILSSEKFFENFSGYALEYTRDAIHEAECPVVVIPENFDFPKRNVIAYDGSASSVHALKQFAYLFPELCINETLLIYIKAEEGIRLPDEGFMEELVTQHYKNLTILQLEFKPRKYFTTWLAEAGNPILICGAFGRSSVSEMFKKSFVTEVIAEHRLPVFIAHV